MAIFHFHISAVQRSRGQSAVEAASYAIRDKLMDDREGRMRNDLNHETADQAVFLGTFLPGGRETDTEELWNRAETLDTRKNAITARKLEIAIPIEFDAEEKLRVAESYTKWLRETFRVATTTGIHLDHEHNPHIHILFTSKRMTPNGEFTDRLKVFDSKAGSSVIVKRMRKQWADTCNKILLQKGYSPISEKTLKEQGIDREPEYHRGVKRHNKMLKEFLERENITKEEYEHDTIEILRERAANDRIKNLHRNITESGNQGLHNIDRASSGPESGERRGTKSRRDRDTGNPRRRRRRIRKDSTTDQRLTRRDTDRGTVPAGRNSRADRDAGETSLLLVGSHLTLLSNLLEEWKNAVDRKAMEEYYDRKHLEQSERIEQQYRTQYTTDAHRREEPEEEEKFSPRGF